MLIDGITIINAPFWLLHPVYCTNVIIRNYRAASLGTNNDGCDPEACTDVLIENCTFDTGDDCIALKAGRGLDGLTNLLLGGQPAPCQNVVVRRCSFANGDGGLTAGSEMSGGVRNVFAEELSMTNPKLKMAVRFKTNSFRGGRIENIHVRNVQVPTGVTNRAISIDYFYEEGKGGPFRPEVTDVFVSNMTVGPNPDFGERELRHLPARLRDRPSRPDRAGPDLELLVLGQEGKPCRGRDGPNDEQRHAQRQESRVVAQLISLRDQQSFGLTSVCGRLGQSPMVALPILFTERRVIPPMASSAGEAAAPGLPLGYRRRSMAALHLQRLRQCLVDRPAFAQVGEADFPFGPAIAPLSLAHRE